MSFVMAMLLTFLGQKLRGWKGSWQASLVQIRLLWCQIGRYYVLFRHDYLVADFRDYITVQWDNLRDVTRNVYVLEKKYW